MKKKHTIIRSWVFYLSFLLFPLFYLQAFSEENPYYETFWNRPYLTGDWGGLRSYLADKGINLDVEYTSTYQGLVSGSGRSNDGYMGKVDVFINLDSHKLNLWEGGGFHTHLEYGHGNAYTSFGGGLFPMNSTRFTPLGSFEEVHATSLYFSQKFGDHASLLFGKINALDLLASDPFFGGWGNHRFMNLSFVAPPSGVVPPVFMGVVGSMKTDPFSWNVMVFDPNNRTADYFPDDLFSDGINISVSSSYSTIFAGRKSYYTLTGTYSHKDGADLSSLSSDVNTTNKNGSYNISLQISYNLQESEKNSNDSWGIFAKAAIADGNPNVINSSITAGIGGDALFWERPQDNFGLGFYYYDFSDDLQNALEPTINFDNELGMEAFYNYAVTPWFHISGDIQYINPADGSREHSFVAGLRTNIQF